MEYILSINDKEYFIESSNELIRLLESTKINEFSELWLQQKDGAALCVLVNKNDSFLMFLQEAGDSGFSSKNLDYTDSTKGEIEFMLSNGQVDRFQKSFCVSTKKAFEAILHFFEKQEKPDWIHWTSN